MKAEENTLLSVIIPVYKVEPYLDACLRSVCGKGMPDSTELILVDDASPDNSGRICDEWAKNDPGITVVHCTKNGGLSKARNIGIDRSHGKYVTFIDSDDYVAPGTIEQAIHHIINYPEIDIIEYPVYVNYGHQEAYIYVPGHDITTDYAGWLTQKGYQHCYAWNKIFKNSLWKKRRFPEGKLFEDIYTIPYVMREASAILRSDKGLYYYCSHAGSISRKLTLRSSYDLLAANLEFYLSVKDSNALTEKDKDDLYLSLCNHQIVYLRLGGELILPARKFSLWDTVLTKRPVRMKFKALLYCLLGERAWNLLRLFKKTN